MIGQTIGSYRVTAKLGAGGMGEVYRATDTRLGREVALKFSAEQFSERFEREARAVAALNHPNICTLYDVAPNYLVMELVEGTTLADRIVEGAIPLDEALGIARQIAAALEEAHEKGITHRDLKPGNIKVTPDGRVKVLDFGLAKFVEAAGASASATLKGSSPQDPAIQLTMSPTITSPAAMTYAGVILGTAAYMAPEQAKGKPVDKRADIWAFGVVLYEMVTGRRPSRAAMLAMCSRRSSRKNRTGTTSRHACARCCGVVWTRIRRSVFVTSPAWISFLTPERSRKLGEVEGSCPPYPGPSQALSSLASRFWVGGCRSGPPIARSRVWT